MRAIGSMPVFLSTLLVAACAGGPPANKDSAEYQAGYSDGCTTGSARASRVAQEPQRNNDLYASSADYRAGWARGYSVCGAGGSPGRL